MTAELDYLTGTSDERAEVSPGELRDDRARRAHFGSDVDPLMVPFDWADLTNARTFGCKVIIAREDDGFVSCAARLPGVVSQGDTFDQALDGIREALSGALATYLDMNVSIPWMAEGEVEACGSDPVSKWIDVDV